MPPNSKFQNANNNVYQYAPGGVNPKNPSIPLPVAPQPTKKQPATGSAITPKLGADQPGKAAYQTPGLKHVAGGQQLWETNTARSNQLNADASALPGQYIQPGQYQDMRAQNQSFVNQIGDYLGTIGQGPSVAELQLNQGMDQALAQQMALAASQRGGGNVGLQQRQLAEQQANIGQNVAGQAALLRAQEDQANQQLMLQGLGLQTQAGQAMQGMDQEMINSLLSQQLGRQQLGLGYQQQLAGLAGMQADAMLGRYQANSSRSAANAGAQNQLLGGIAQGVGSFLAADAVAPAVMSLFSDENLKEDIQPVSKKDMKELKDTLKAVSFKYKNEAHGKGDFVGILAQDLEKSKIGKSMVVEKDGHKAIDTNKIMSLFLATLAEG